MLIRRRQCAVKKAAGMAKEVPSMYGHLPQLVADTIKEGGNAADRSR